MRPEFLQAAIVTSMLCRQRERRTAHCLLLY
jgi:hypothetical protein